MKGIISALLSIFIAAWLSGCASTPAIGTIDNISMTYQNDGSIAIKGRTYSLTSVVSVIRSYGAGKNTAINIKIPADLNQRDMATVYKQLRSGGFTKIFFTEPKKVITNQGSYKSKSAK